MLPSKPPLTLDEQRILDAKHSLDEARAEGDMLQAALVESILNELLEETLVTGNTGGS